MSVAIHLHGFVDNGHPCAFSGLPGVFKLVGTDFYSFLRCLGYMLSLIPLGEPATEPSDHLFNRY